MNDVHLDIEADPDVMPVFGNETTQVLLNTMLQKAKDSGNVYDAVLLPGDFVKHGIDSSDTTKPNYEWDLALSTIQTAIETIQSYFPDVPILPAIGNNDCYYHN